MVVIPGAGWREFHIGQKKHPELRDPETGEAGSVAGKMEELKRHSAQVQHRPFLRLTNILPFPKSEGFGHGVSPGWLVGRALYSHPFSHGIDRAETGSVLPGGPEFGLREEGIKTDMVGVVMGIEEKVDFFFPRQSAEGFFFAGRVHQQSLSAFDQNGVAVGVRGELAEKDFQRADFVSLDHFGTFPSPGGRG